MARGGSKFLQVLRAHGQEHLLGELMAAVIMDEMENPKACQEMAEFVNQPHIKALVRSKRWRAGGRKRAKPAVRV